jgi:hypothetical protein
MKDMNKILAVGVILLFVGVTIAPTINFNTVKASQQNVINERINQRELLFQTICDIANNKEIQLIILKSQMSKGIFPTSEMPVLTKHKLRQMYFMGLILSKFISKTRLQSMVHKYQLITPELQQEINAIIEKDVALNTELIQLQNSECDCENENPARFWRFPIICTLLIPLFVVGLGFCAAAARWDALFAGIIGILTILPIQILSHILQCWWHLLLNSPPFISDISPADGEQNVSLSLTKLSFKLTDNDRELMSYKVTTSPDIGSGSGILKPSGTYTIPIDGVQINTEYIWKVEVSDNQVTTVRNYSFSTVMTAPIVSNPLPKHTAKFVPLSWSNVSFDLKNYQGNLMSWTVKTQPDIGAGAGNGVGNGRYMVPISGLEYNTKYTWFVNATDGTNWTRKTFVFTTISEGLMVLEPSADTFVGEYSPDVNHGSNSYMLVSDKYGYTSNYDARGMVVFNLSEIPSGITIDSVDLSLYYYRYDDTNPVDREITCHRILENRDV